MNKRLIPFLVSLATAGVALGDEARPAPAPAEPAPVVPHLAAGFGNEAFFVRSDDDNFVLIPGGRFQFDWYGYQGGSKAPFNTFNPKRVRIEAAGTFLKHWDFNLASELTGATTPLLTDAFIVANYTPYANVQLGQFDAPFTMENRTGDKWTDLQERSTVVRAFGIPENKEIGAMVFGQPEGKWAYWSLGLFNGEGQNQFAHRSNNFDVMGRAWFAPFGFMKYEPLKNAWVGASFWEGNRKSGTANQLDRLPMKDAAGFTFFSPVSGTLHTGDQGALNKYATELNVPFGPIVAKGEYVRVGEELREIDTAAGVVRTAHLGGNGFYLRLSYFVWGDPLINGLAGSSGVPHLFGELKPGKTATALQLVAEYDSTSFTYTPGDDSTSDPFAGGYGFRTLGIGANYWATKHVRLTGNFLYNMISGAALTPLASSQTSYELMFRGAVAL